MDGEGEEGEGVMMTRIILFAGYFLGMLLLASWLTGVLQQGILPRFRHQQAPSGEETPPAAPTPHKEAEPAASTSTEDMRPVPLVLRKEPQPAASTPQKSTRPQEGSKSAPELDALNKALAAKRAELARMEEQIRRQKAQGEIEEKWLAELKASSAKVTKDRDDRREAGIRKVARLYEGMQPEAAASILGNLEKSMAAEVLASMKDRQASRVLQAMNDQKARELSERLQDARLPRTPGEGTDKQEAQ
jgi:flagellar motility protein MotE (MotC chaperone)